MGSKRRIRLPRLTAAMLRARDACGSQVAIFAGEWPDGVVPTVRAIQRARTLGLDVEWCRCLLPAPALAEYDRVTAPAWAEYKRVRDAVLSRVLRAELARETKEGAE